MEWKIRYIDVTDSTNRWLKSRLTADAGGAADHFSSELGTRAVVVADYQTAGRGCGTNRWESERGQNLLFSMLIHPTDLPANRQFRVSMAIANSIAKVLSSYVGQVSIKWPNDIYVGDRKICGILIENSLQGSVISDSIIGRLTGQSHRTITGQGTASATAARGVRCRMCRSRGCPFTLPAAALPSHGLPSLS